MTEDKYFKRRAARMAAVRDPLEETVEMSAQSISGIWRRNAAGEFVSAMSRSERFVPPHIDLTKRQAE